MRQISIWLVVGLLSGIILVNNCKAENFCYLEMKKTTNNSYVYYLPKLELSKTKVAGKFFGQKVNYLTEFEGGLVFTAPRANASAINHHSIEAEYHVGIEAGPFWTTFSIGFREPLEGNSDGLTEAEFLNTLRLGISF